MDRTRLRKGLNGAVAAGVMIWAAAAVGACSSDPGTTVITGSDAAVGCGAGSQACGGVCTVIARDSENCGACGTKCASGQVCSQGACAVSCGGGTTKCGDLCVDTKADGENCGACATKCASGQVCSKGACAGTCGAGLAQCGQTCVNEQNDRTNCGACGTVCGGGEICNAGKCELSCQVGLIKCAAPVSDGGVPDGGGVDASLDGGDGGASLGTTYCANPQSDAKNCGGCGITCGSGKVCSNGVCATTCGGSTTTCGSGNNAYCANLQTDNTNCGACGTTCGSFTKCTAGACATSGCPDVNDVLFQGKCYYLNGSNGVCAAGYALASNANLAAILAANANIWQNKNYRATVSNNCCIRTSDNVMSYGMTTNCNNAGPFAAGQPVAGGSACTNITPPFTNSQQLTVCVTQ